MKRQHVILVFTISAFVSLQISAQAAETDPIEAMQKVIDQQRKELDAQNRQLESQQQRLDEQQEVLESMQLQLHTLARDRGSELDGTDSTGEVHLSKADKAVESGLTATDGGVDPSVDSAPASRVKPSYFALNQPGKSINDDHIALDTRPLDVPDDTGIFIYSKDANKVLRLYGSLRALSIFDNRQNFHPYDLNIPQIPVGEDDVKDWNHKWTINTTKLGFQVGVQDYFTVLSEFDFKGERGDALRIRHMYMRTKHWLAGQHWTVFNTLSFLPLAIDSHSTSAHLGARPVQIKYLDGKGHWNYQLALEYYQPKFNEPEFLDTSARNMMPNLAANLSHVKPWGMVRVAGLLSANKVRYSYGDQPRTTSSDLGLALMAGIKVSLDENNLIKAHIQRTDGNSQYGPDYSFGNYDMVFNPDTGEFQNLKAWGAQIALEHKWSPTLTTAIGAGYMSMDSKDYQHGEFFDHGYKALVNLFYRPAQWLKSFAVAGELEFAGQTTRDGSRGDTTRVSVLLLYDF